MDQRDIGKADSYKTDENDRSNDLNKPMKLVDTEFEMYDECSQDLFDDDESLPTRSPCINLDSSSIARINSPAINLDVTTNLTQTPKICGNESSPYHPTVPKIPSSLIPFISTVNESWTSDLETPQAKTTAEMNLQNVERSRQLLNSCEIMERKVGDTIRSNGIIPDVTTPNGYFVSRIIDEEFTTSPILNTMTRRRRPKRRILKTLIDATNSMENLKDMKDGCHESSNEINKNKSGGSGSEENPLENNTSSIDDATFVVDENGSLHNTNIHLLQDEMNEEKSHSVTEDEPVINNDFKSTLVGIDGEECLLNERLGSCEDLEEIDHNDITRNEQEDLKSLDNAAEHSVNEAHEKSVAELVREIKELEKNEEQITEYKYADIPMDVFMRDAKALAIAEITPLEQPDKLKTNKKQWGLISFTEMCLLEEKDSDTADSGIEGNERINSLNENSECLHAKEKNELTILESVHPSDKNHTDDLDNPSVSFIEKNEPPIDIDEFSPWFYQTNDASNNRNTEDNLNKQDNKSNLISQEAIDEKATSSNHRENKEETNGANSAQLYGPIGFSTASGKPIKISEDKIRNAEKLYDEIVSQDEQRCNIEMLRGKTGDYQTDEKNYEAVISQGSIGFSTANGKQIKISDDKLKAAEKLYNEIVLQDELNCNDEILPKVSGVRRTDNENNEGEIPQNSYLSVGFSTASGKRIEINEDKLEAAQKLYDGIVLQDEWQNDAKILPKVARVQRTDTEENEAKVVENSSSAVGFSTASGKPIKIDEDRLKAAEKLYNDINSTDNLQLPDLLEVSTSRGIKRSRECDEIDSHEICGTDPSVEFRNTTGEQSSSVTKSAVKKVKTMNQSEDIPQNQLPRNDNLTRKLKNSTDEEKNEINSKPMLSSGFQTVSSGYVGIMESSTRKAEITLNNEDPCKLQRSPGTVHDKASSISDVRQSEELELKNSCNAFLLDNSTKESQGSDDSRNHTSETLCEQKSTFRKRLSDNHAIDTESSNPMTSISIGFSTANGKAIQISEQALLNARNMLDDEIFSNEQALVPGEDYDYKSGRIETLPRVKKLFSAEQENTPPPNSLKKRNIIEMETPATYNGSSFNFQSGLKSVSENMSSDILQTSKKVRFNSDFQARKLFSENDGESDKEIDYPKKFYAESNKNPRTPLNTLSIQTRTTGLYAKSEMFETTDRLMMPKLEAQKSSPLDKSSNIMEFAIKMDRKISVYSEEITASTEALLADEENSMDRKSWASAITCSPTFIEDRDIAVEPITLDINCKEVAQGAPTSPIIGTKIRSRKKIKRNKKNILKIANKNDCCDMNGCEDPIIVTSNSQQSSGIHTSSSNSSHRNLDTVIDTALISELERLEEFSTRIESSDNQCENLVGVTMSEIEEREVLDFISESRIAAALAQDKQIRAKKKSKPKPIPGCLFIRKNQNKSRASWKQVSNGVQPTARNPHELRSLGIQQNVMEVTAANALKYRFKCSDFYSKAEILANPYGIETGDGSRLIFNENGYASVLEFERAFIASPGVDPTLLPLRWVENHYRWIVWKLASMDRMKFGNLCMTRMLTPRNVMEQLKYRYDREIDKSERPALRRIIEKDDPPCRRMILCVATITKTENTQVSETNLKTNSTSHWRIELTDGWYSIMATIDSAMAHLIAFGKVREGTKLVTCRAELLNSEQGCSPLEIPADVSLKIHTNSTRRSKWDAKLGYCRHAAPIPTSLSAILPNGGLIGKLNTVIARVYPIQYFEKTPGGQSVFRNNRCEDKAILIYEKERQKQIDIIYSQARAKFEAIDCKHKSSGDADSDEMNYRSTSGEAFQREVESMLRSNLPPPRKVTLVLKVRIMEGDNLAILTVWAPSEDIIDVLKEGSLVSVHNVQTSGKRSGELQLTAGHQSYVKLEKSNVSPFPQRCLTSITEIPVAGFNPPFSEFDTVGIVVSLGPAPHGMKNFEVVNLAYPNSETTNSEFLSILFWEGIGAHGFSDIFIVGATVACINLQWRRGVARIIPVAYSTENSTFTRNPRQAYLRSAFESVKKQIKDPMTYASECAAEIAMEHQKKSNILRSPVVQGTPSTGSPCAGTFQDKLCPGTSPQTPQNLVNQGESTTPAKYSIQRRLEKLNWYGEPPELSPISLKHGSMNINQKFVPPVRTPEDIERVIRRREMFSKKINN